MSVSTVLYCTVFYYFNLIPGLPCRGSSVSVNSLDKDKGGQKAEQRQQKTKSSRSKQQLSQENGPKPGKADGAVHTRPQASNQKAGIGDASSTNTTKPTVNNQSEALSKKVYPRYQKQPYYMTNRRSWVHPGRQGPVSGGSRGNGGRYQKQQWSTFQGRQQASLSSSSEHTRPHNPTQRPQGSGSHDHKSVTPVPASNSSNSNDPSRNVSQYNNFPFGAAANRSSPARFQSFPPSPSNHGEMATGMVVPQTATDANGGSKKGETHHWHFKDSTAEGQKLELPDPGMWNWNNNGHQFGFGQRDYAETVEDPFSTMTIVGDDKEFEFKDLEDFDAKHLEEFFPALKPQIPGRYDDDIYHPPAQCTGQSGRNGAQMQMLAGDFLGYQHNA